MAINPSEITTIRVGELPIGTIELTSKMGVENGTDLQQVTGQDLINFVNINANAFQFEIKDLWVSQAYIDDNFDGTGLGIELCEGYAICNGQNGTPNLDGLVSIGYGNNYNVIKAIGGTKNATLISHNHIYTDDINAENKFPSIQSRFPVKTSGAVTATSSATGDGAGTTYYTSTVGESGINKNMQPYMVLLKIMKL